MPRHFGWNAFAFGFGPRGFWGGPRGGGRRRQWFEDEGLVVAKDVEGKKVYEITDAGRKFLDEHRDMVDDIFDRVREAVDRTLGGAMGDVNRSLGRLVKAVYRAGWKARYTAF